MRIVYGVHGYGLGHSARATSLLPRLGHHQVLLLAGGEACAALAPLQPVTPLPSLERAYASHRTSAFATAIRSGPTAVDAVLGGPARRRVEDLVAAFKPHLVISDGEPFTHQAAARLAIPRIGFDHLGILAHCHVSAPPGRELHLAAARRLYRLLMGEPERAVVASFYRAPVARAGVALVSALPRPDVVRARPRRGEYLLVQLDRARRPLSPRVLHVLREARIPCVVHGAHRDGADGLLRYRRAGAPTFVDDLAGCRAVLSTADDQIVGEALHLGKSVLAVPDDTTEQRLGGAALDASGAGRQVPAGALDLATLLSFLEAAELHAAAAGRAARCGTDAALAALDAFARELCGKPLATAPAPALVSA